MDDDLFETCVHEAGHAVLLAAHGFIPYGVSIWFNADAVRPWSGNTVYDTIGALPGDDPCRIEDELVCGLGGRAVEELWFGPSLPPAADEDWAKMRDLVKLLEDTTIDADQYIESFWAVCLRETQKAEAAIKEFGDYLMTLVGDLARSLESDVMYEGEIVVGPLEHAMSSIIVRPRWWPEA